MKQSPFNTDGPAPAIRAPELGGHPDVRPPQERDVGGEAQTTNNRMELTGAISALRALKEPCQVELYSDSKYVIDAWRRAGPRAGGPEAGSRGTRSPPSTPTCGSSCWSCVNITPSTSTG